MIPLKQMTAGMAACIREWILPYLSDAMARIQAEQLIVLLNELPRSFEPAALKRIKADTEEGALLLRNAGEAIDCSADGWDVDQLMAENAEVKERLEALAQRCRAVSESDAACERLLEIQRYFVRSARREGEGAQTQVFAELTTRDRDGKQDLRKEDSKSARQDGP
ncbi:hypothetical protein [Steroidobacter denitrificans]|nr:hypothetical protein [Steroidobacter denitrificans]